jgi:glutathione S-transferase
MILIGQYDSPFVRRVAIAMKHYGIPYEHRNWSVWGDADKLGEVNPLRRVPVLVLDDGSALVESYVILDTLDEMVGPERALLPRSGAVRREGLRIGALCTGLADKAVSLLYERLFRPSPSARWVERCKRQIDDTLLLLEEERARRASPHWLGETLTHTDIAFGCAIRFTREAHPELFDPARFPSLAGHAARCEELEVFRSVVLPITNIM